MEYLDLANIVNYDCGVMHAYSDDIIVQRMESEEVGHGWKRHDCHQSLSRKHKVKKKGKRSVRKPNSYFVFHIFMPAIP